MDIVEHCLSTTPVSHLAPAFSTLRFIWSDAERAQVAKRQLRALTQSIAQFLDTLHTKHNAGRLLQVRTSVLLEDLCRFVNFSNTWGINQYVHALRFLDAISVFVHKETQSSFLKLLFTKSRRISQIDSFYRQLVISAASFEVCCTVLNAPCRYEWRHQISTLVDVIAWQTRNDDARAADQRVLDEMLFCLENNEQQLKETLSALCRRASQWFRLKSS